MDEVLRDPLYNVDENSLCKVDRLGLAYCRLNGYGWDDIIGPKPKGFDGLPDYDPYAVERIHHPIIMGILAKLFPEKYGRKPTKHDFVYPAMRGIESEIGGANTSRCHWIYGLGKTEQEWREWYCSERFLG